VRVPCRCASVAATYKAAEHHIQVHDYTDAFRNAATSLRCCTQLQTSSTVLVLLLLLLLLV
jgi:hypothetical protein